MRGASLGWKEIGCQIHIFLGEGGPSWGEQQSWRPVWGDRELSPIPPCEGWELLGVGTSPPSWECFQGGC